MSKHDRPISFRGPTTLYDRADALRARLAKDGPDPDLKTAVVLRMALERGLDELERKYRTKR